MRWENETVFHTTQFNGTITPSANGKECSANIEGELGTWQIKILATVLRELRRAGPTYALFTRVI
jgi:hypothetical protein